MKDKCHYIAVDLGAESGRVMLATCTQEELSIQEVHRFPNGAIEETGALHWDFAHLMTEIKAGLKKALQIEPKVCSIGVDTWGVDYGLIDAQGQLLENPYHYRDQRNNGMIDQAAEILPREKIYALTGIQFMQFNTVFQVLACKQQRPELLEQAQHLLFMANLIMYFLCDNISAEYTMASTSQMMDMQTGQWSDELLGALDLPRHILPPITQPGEQAGLLSAELAKELGCERIPVVAVGTHDTASAVAAIPVTHDKNWAYLSSGTWSLMGIETPGPIINDATFKLDYTNEGGIGNTIRLLKNIMGLWLVQESRRHWAAEGDELDYSQITQMALEAQPFQGVLDTGYAEFLAPGEMPEKINRYLQSTGQTQLSDKGEIVRVILESLALKYRQVIRSLEDLSGRPIEVLHIVGGGIQNELLNQLTADATGKTVATGPVEATVIGNVMVQALAQRQIKSLSEGRALVARSFAGKVYAPGDGPAWQDYAQKAVGLVN